MPHKSAKRARMAALEAALAALNRVAKLVIVGQGGAATMKRIMEAQDLLSRKIHQIKGG